MKVVFCGTPMFAVPTLDKLGKAGFAIELVVTQPDRPRGRGMEVGVPPVKQQAMEMQLPTTQPEKIKNNTAFREQLNGLQPDVIIVVGYGRIIPDWMIVLPPFGNINLHASLLPKYRGAAPIQWAIAGGESQTGVTTMRIDAGLDTGDILLQEEVPISSEDTTVTLAPKLASIGADLMIDTLRRLENRTLRPHPQDHSKATIAPVLKKDDGRIDFHRSAEETCNRLRGFQPWPGAFTTFRGKNLNIWQARPVHRTVLEGEILLERDTLIVGTGESTALEVIELQPEGKKRMAIHNFIHGYRPRTGEKLGG